MSAPTSPDTLERLATRNILIGGRSDLGDSLLSKLSTPGTRKERRARERAEAKVQAKMRQFRTQLEEITA